MRDYIHVSDLASATSRHSSICERGGKSEVLNCGYGNGFSVLEVIDTARRVSGTDFPVHFGPRRAWDPPMLVAQVDRIREVLDWSPRIQRSPRHRHARAQLGAALHRASLIHPSSAYDKQRFCPGFFRLDPCRSPNAQPALRDHMILACEIMKWTAKSTDSAESTLAPQYSPPSL